MVALPSSPKLLALETPATSRITPGQQQLTQHKDCTFEGEVVPLDNSSFEGCTFRKCTIAYAGGPARLVRNRFTDCSFELVGGAANGLFLLRTLGLVGSAASNVKATPGQIAIEIFPSGNTTPVG